MESSGSDREQREQFAKQGGEALNLDGDFNDSEEVDEEDEDDPQEMMKPSSKKDGGSNDKG